LQLINHWQDVGIDIDKGPRGRIYLPQEDLQRFGVSENTLLCRSPDTPASADFLALLRFEVDRARTLMLSGARLGHDLPGRIGLEIRTIVAGGLRILDKIEAVDYDVFRHRPVLGWFDWPRILLNAVRP
jgi:phytoene synthase